MDIGAREKKIIEERTIEATKKNFMGLNGKLGCIVKNLGDPIWMQSEGGSLFTSTEFDSSPQERHEPRDHIELMDGIPTMEVCDFYGNPIQEPTSKEWHQKPNRTEFTTDIIGWQFDGLSRGMRLYISYREETGQLAVTFQDHPKPVYEEVAGELVRYVPLAEWEDLIEQLYAHAKKKGIKNRKIQKQQETKQAERNKAEWLRDMRDKWGF